MADRVQRERERERERDRDSGSGRTDSPSATSGSQAPSTVTSPGPSSPPQSATSSSVHPLAFLPNLFGRRTSSKTASDARKATASSGVTRTSIDDVNPLASPPAGTVPLPGGGAGAGASAPGAPAPFHLDHALALMKPGATKNPAELVEVVKSTSVYLANVLLDHTAPVTSGASTTSVPTASQPPLAELGLSAADLRALYDVAMTYSDPKQDYNLRTAALRLLAVLLGAAPPRDSLLESNPYDLPPSVSRRAVYRLITAFSGGTPGPASTNQIYVEVGTLKALTREGTVVDGMEGIIGWMLKTLSNLTPAWIEWCGTPDDNTEVADGPDTPFGPIKSATPAVSAAALIDLLDSIVQHRAALFSPADLTHIVEPVVEFLWRGIVATPPYTPVSTALAHSTIGHRSTRSSTSTQSQAQAQQQGGTQSATASPAHRPRLGDVRRATSLTVGRVEPFPSMTSSTKPPKSPVRAASTRQPKWSRPFKSLCAFVHQMFETTTVNDDLFDQVFELLALVFGQDDQDAMMDAEMQLGANDLARTMLGAKSGRRGELALRRALEGKLVITRIEGRKSADIERKVTRGAVIIARLCVIDAQFQAQSGSLGLTFANLAPSLVAAESTSRFPGKAEARAADWTRWQPVDAEILAFLDVHLGALEGGVSHDTSSDAWTEGEAASEVLDGLLPVIENMAPSAPRTLLRGEGEPLVATYSAITHRVPQAIGRLNSMLHSSSSPGEGPTTPPPFYHPNYVELLLSLGQHLDEDTAAIVIDHYQRECLCLPFTSGWIKNTWRLLEAFGQSYDLPVARVRVSHLLYHDIYGYVQDLPEHRAQLVDQVLVPYLSKWLPDETDHGLLTEALGVLVSAAVAETQEKDEERRRSRAPKPQAELDAEDANPLPSQEIVDAVSGGSFADIRALIAKLAMTSPCVAGGHASRVASHASVATASSAQEGLGSREARSSREGRSREPGGLRSLMRTLSPARQSQGQDASPPQAVSALLSPPVDELAPPPSIGSQTQQLHMACKSLEAVKALIAIFTRLAFTTPLAGSQSSLRPVRTPASARCIEVYRDLLHLLYAINDGNAGLLPAKCPRGRLTVLQWAMRLRADRKHRILFRGDINRFVMPFAQVLYRTKETEDVIRAQIEAEDARRRERAERNRAGGPVASAAGGREDERGRSVGSVEATGRSRSRSKAPERVIRTTAPEPNLPYNPLWVLPETLSFEAPPDNHPSEGLLTYDPNHPSLRDPNAPLVEGAWLPVSEYVRVLNGILRWETDWELVSYVFAFLPQQLGNKHFFHGTRATREIRGLQRVLCDGVVSTKDRWERRYSVPSFIKRAHINSIAYQSLSIMISYRSVLDRAECDRLVDAFKQGLEAHSLLAKPCLQALTISIYELESNVSRVLLQILERMQQILSMPNVAVHVLEFLVALGNSTLYRNFTEDQYRLVFAVAIGYIAEHNARTDQASDFAHNRESVTLSQHVIGLAYHAIYLWFLNIRVSQRPQYVSYLIQSLLHAKSQRGNIDERTEVCFDWIARYTYGNADPKPAQSFLSKVVMSATTNDDQPPKSLSWVLGGAILTVTTHKRSGWATITTTRPTGQTSVVCKLENEPLLDVGEDNADLTSLPAFLMANREEKLDINEEVKVEVVEKKAQVEANDKDDARDDSKDDTKEVVKADDEGKTEPQAQGEEAKLLGFDPKATAIAEVKSTVVKTEAKEYVWSGATPSQRRKDVSIEPAYIGLQLLSSYPNTDLRTPRGRLIPKEPKFERALRGIDNTPVINTFRIAVLYVGPGQTTETEILGNVDGSPLYLDFLAGLGRIIRLKDQIDVYTGGMDRENDNDGKYAYAWWNDLAQMIFHAPTLMPNIEHLPDHTNKKRLVGNDYVKIVYNESGRDFAFDTIKTEFNFVNIVISPYATRDVADAGSLVRNRDDKTAGASGGEPAAGAGAGDPFVDEWGGDSEDYFKIVLQRAEGIPDFSPIGEYKLVSRKNLPILVRQIAHYANSMAMRFQHIKNAPDAESAEFITIWRARYRALKRLRDMLPKAPEAKDEQEAEELLRDFSTTFTPAAITAE